MTNAMSPEDHLRARIESQRQEIELLRDQRDTNLAKEVELVQRLTNERDQYKIWWERDSTSLGKALNEASSLRAGKEQFRAEVGQLRTDISQAYDLRDKAEGRYCTALGDIERLQKEIDAVTKDRDDLQEKYNESVLSK